jgi:hypothetical protein
MEKILETPPSANLFEDVEEHPENEHTIRIEFYKKPDGDYFVWPYIKVVRGSSDTVKHFQLLGYFPTKEAARDAALAQGKALIAAGFKMD